MAQVTVGILLALFGLVPYALQTRKVLLRRSAGGLSFGYCLMLTWSSAIWIAHGSFCRNWVQVGIESFSLAMCAVLLVAFMRYEGARLRTTLGTSIVFAVLLLGVCHTGSAAVSFVALAMPVLCRLPQVVRTFLSEDTVGVSVPAFSIALLVELLWIINGALVGDVITIIAAGMCASEALCVALRSFDRNRGRSRSRALSAPVH